MGDVVTGVDSALTGRIKAFCLQQLNADLVGVANIARFAKAPLRMSPQGLMPSARSVVSMALHHPDACVELGGEEHPQIIGPYRVQYLMNSRLDELSYRLACFLEDEGYQAMPIVSSNIWRYKGYKELTEQFAPDLSHRHAAVAAGIADFGFSALAITPEFGARVRFVTVITDAELEPDPLIPAGTVCDDCQLCTEMCPASALDKEVAGLSVVEIEDQRYTYANKNLWRCSWGEHFDLDLDLPIPPKVDEDVILKMVAEHGVRGGEMGCCLRYCVPPDRRVQDPGYSSTARRLRREPDPLGDRRTEQELRARAHQHGADFVLIHDAAELAALGIELADHLPDGLTAVTVGLHYAAPEGPDGAASARRYLLDSAAYDITRDLERAGWSAVCFTALPSDQLHARIEGILPGRRVETHTVVCAAPLPSSGWTIPTPRAVCPPARLRDRIEALAKRHGADLVGACDAARLEAVKDALTPHFAGQTRLHARDKSKNFKPYDPEITVETSRVLGPSDHLSGAKAVLVLGLRVPRMAVERTALPPAEAVGPYGFAQYESINLLRLAALRVMRELEDLGYRAALTFDLEGTGSKVANPRGEQPDAFCNRFTAVAAGLARLSKAGFPVTDRFGPDVRFVALVTDAPLEDAPALADASLVAACDSCQRCVAACQTDAFGEALEIPVDGGVERFLAIDRTRCDWAKRYSMIGEEGVNFLGWDFHIDAPEVITPEALASALRQQPPIPKYRPVMFEGCLMACPLARPQ